MLLLLLFSLITATCFTQSVLEKLNKALVTAGYENVRVTQAGGVVFVSLEDNIYSWNVTGICSIADTLLSCIEHTPVSMVMLDKGIPQIKIDIEPSSEKYPLNISVSYDINEAWSKLKDIPPCNPPENKIDVVVYPQFTLQNVLLSQIYEIQLNLAPAVEISLWKGMLFTGQVIFPLKNDLGYEGDFIRPGFVTLTQNFRLPHAWFARASIGNFNASRYGADICLNHPLPGNHWNIGGNAGLTGSSHFYEGEWITGELNTLTWFAKTGYYYPEFDLQFDLGFGCFLNHDYGFRADCTRHFGATTVGFYATYTNGHTNGGFHFSTPLPPFKRNRRHTVRFVPAKYFDWEYNAGTEFYYGRYYETRPNENRSEHWINPLFLKNEILKTK